MRRRINIARRAGLPLVEVEAFVRKFRDIRTKMARFVRKYEAKNIVSTYSRQHRQSEKLARAREPARGFGPPIENSVLDLATREEQEKQFPRTSRSRRAANARPKK